MAKEITGSQISVVFGKRTGSDKMDHRETGFKAAVANKEEVVSRVVALASKLAKLTLMMHSDQGNRTTGHIGES